MSVLFWILVTMFFVVPSQAQFQDVQKAGNPMLENMVFNGGFEQVLAGWTTSSGNLSQSTAIFAYGKASGQFDATATGQTITSKAVTVPPGLHGKNIVFGCQIKKEAAGTSTYQIGLYDGTSESYLTSIVSSSSQFAWTLVNAVAPSSGTLAIRIKSQANEPQINIDNCGIWDANFVNVSQVNQTQFVGSAYFATTASCTWGRTNTALGAFSTTAACPGPTVDSNPGPGTIQTTDADLPRVTVNNLPPGRYMVTFQAMNGISSASNNRVDFAINDGSTTSNLHAAGNGYSGFSGNSSVVAFFEYTTTGNRTFELYGSARGGETVTIYNDLANTTTTFTIVRFPSQSEIAFRPETQIASEQTYDGFAGFGSTNTTVVRFSTNRKALGTDVTYTASASDGDKFTINTPGIYTISAHAGATSGANAGITVNGTALTTNVRTLTYAQGLRALGQTSGASSESNAFSWTGDLAAGDIVRMQGDGTALTNSAQTMITVKKVNQTNNAPLLVGSVTSGNTGALRIEAAEINCDASSSVVSQTYSSFVSAVGNRSSTSCSITFSSGTWASAPYCNFSTKAAANSSGVTVTSATAATVFGPAADYDGYLTCIGSR